MWKLLRLFLLCLLGGLALGACATEQKVVQTQQAPADIEEQIGAVRTEFMELYQQGNAQGLSEFFAEDASFTGTVSAVWRQDREEIRTNFQNFFTKFPKREVTFQPQRLTYYNIPPQGAVMDTTVVVEIGVFGMLMVDGKGQSRSTYGKYNITRVKQNGRWIIVNLHTSRPPVSP